MLACRLDVDVQFDYGLTTLSAVVSVAFTFLVLSSGYVTGALENSRLIRIVSSYAKAFCDIVMSFVGQAKQLDVEAGYLPLNTSDSDLPRDDDFPAMRDEEEASNNQDQDQPSDAAPDERGEHVENSTTSTRFSSASETFLVYPMSSGDSEPTAMSWSDSLNASLSHETQMRVQLQTEKAVNWVPWLKAHYNSMTFAVAIKAVIWGAALGFIHYCGKYKQVSQLTP